MQDTLTLLWIKLMIVFSILHGIMPMLMLEWMMTAAFAASVVALLGLPAPVQIAIFSVIAALYFALLFYVRQRLRAFLEGRHLGQEKDSIK